MRLLILDRDGVINEDSEAFVKSVDEWIPIAGSLEAIAHANQIGFSRAAARAGRGVCNCCV